MKEAPPDFVEVPLGEDLGFEVILTEQESYDKLKKTEPQVVQQLLEAHPQTVLRMVAKVPILKALGDNEAFWQEKYALDFSEFLWHDAQLFQTSKEAYTRRAMSCCMLLAGNVADVESKEIVDSIVLNFQNNNRIIQISCKGDRMAYVTADHRLFLLGYHSDALTPRLKTRAIKNRAIEVTLNPKQPIKQVSCGHNYTAFVTKAGELFAFGENNKGVLGHGYNDTVTIPRPMKVKTQNKVAHVSCGGLVTAYITTNKQLFVCCKYFDTKDNLPAKVADGGVEQVSCGKDHLAYVTTNGKLFVMGHNSFQKLGVAAKQTDLLTQPREITDEYFKHSTKNVWLLDPAATPSYYGKVVKVSCGEKNTAFITSDKNVYVVGKSITLGLEQDFLATLGGSYIAHPKRLPLQGMVDVSCGRNHIAMISAAGKLWTVGQCANEDEVPNKCILSYNKTLTPTKVGGVTNALSVECGTAYTAVLTMKAHEPIKVSKPGFFSGWF